jgi:hypothetical protein
MPVAIDAAALMGIEWANRVTLRVDTHPRVQDSDESQARSSTRQVDDRRIDVGGRHEAADHVREGVQSRIRGPPWLLKSDTQ